MFLAMARPRPVPPRFVVKYGSNTCGRCAGSMPAPRSAMTIVTRPSFASRATAVDEGLGTGLACRLPTADCDADWTAPLTAWRALTSMLTSAMRSRSASVVTGAACGSRFRCTWAPGPDASEAAADSRHSAFRSAGASWKRIGLAKSRTSFTMRFSRSTSSSMSATASRIAAGAEVRLAQRVQRSLDDHQRVPHFVRDDGRQAAERRQPLLLRHLALEPRDRVRQRVEGRRQQLRVFVVPAAALGEGDLARQIAGGGDLAHDVGDGRQRPRDRARDGEAEERREQHGDERGDGEARCESRRASGVVRCATAGSARRARPRLRAFRRQAAGAARRTRQGRARRSRRPCGAPARRARGCTRAAAWWSARRRPPRTRCRCR